jgi:hypothetical protein
VTTKTPTRIAFNVAVLVLAIALVPAALADKGGSGKGGSPKSGTTGSGNTQQTVAPPIAQTSEYVWNNPNPAAPLWCLNEDDIDQRAFSGSLSGVFSTTYQLCNSSTDYSGGVYWSAGGEGIESDVYVVGQLTDLTISAPDGTTHRGVLVGSTTSQGTTTYHYAVCYCPPYYLSSNTGTKPLPGGIWTIALSGQIATASWTTTADMTDVTFQQSHCPATEQNLLP